MYTGTYTCFMSSHSITRQESLKALTVLVTDKAEECVERQSLKHSFMFFSFLSASRSSP